VIRATIFLKCVLPIKKDPDPEIHSSVTHFLPTVIGVLDLLRLLLAAPGATGRQEATIKRNSFVWDLG
jgi:hypothetical protein